ncbi:hypothetical protein F7725_028362 [Dissostichus mawsoni]|uniref:Integrase core domain-containing protein n=1 Tax=Dissostichus mawsoni TaxID=36200 RepID=A0A7J5XFK7_DISMA|nr:hypothetical protein F7725_028362 [Dissostichus mawsoni]
MTAQDFSKQMMPVMLCYNPQTFGNIYLKSGDLGLPHPHNKVGHSGYHAPLILLGGRGPPQFSISREQLFFEELWFYSNKDGTDIKSISAHSETAIEFHMLRSGTYSTISDATLDDLIKEIVAGNNQIGPESVRAQLQAQQMWIQRRRVRDSMRRIDPEAAALRAMSQRLHRRAYRVAGPNSLWHLDGNHKSIRWVEPPGRLPPGLRQQQEHYRDGELHGRGGQVWCALEVRTDHGGENNSVCLMMNIFRGSHRGSALRGRSTHNQRIERLWGDLWRGVSNVYYDLFNFLENEGIIDIDNEMHMWALHYVSHA